MFEGALLTKLAADATLTAYVSTYNGAPAIFSEHAPEGADMPYIVFRITRTADAFPGVQAFTVFVDYYDYDVSASNSRKAAEQIEFLLDRVQLSDARYSNIRLFFSSGGSLEGVDPRTVRYNLMFTARAGRKKWIDNNHTS